MPCEIVVFAPHPDGPALLVRSDDPARLPSLSIEGEFHLPAALAAIERMLGAASSVLRVGHLRTDANDESELVAIDLEAVGPEAPEGFVWADMDALAIERLDPAELRATIPRWIERRRSGPTPADPPWSRPGWTARASAWAEAQLRDAGMPATGATEAVYAWGISMVLRTPTARGAAYLKATSPVFGHEASVTARLAEVSPAEVTRVIAVEPDEGWLLMHDHGDAVVGDAPPETWAAPMGAYARLQRAWATRTEDLAAAGAEIRSLAALAEIVPMLADRPPLVAEFRAGERAEWDAAVPRFVAACRRLDALGPGPTLSHGDLHPWNIAATPDGPRFFDWSDTAVAHPFLDLAVYATRPKDPSVRRAIRDAYLIEWADVLPAADLVEAGELAIVVGALYQVESYERILTGIDPDDRGGLEGATRSWALGALGALRDGIDLTRPGHADG